EDVAGALALQRLDQRRDEGLVAGRLARYADDVDVVFNRLASGLLRGLEQWADIDVEADIGKGGGDDLGAAVVAVLAQFGHQHAGASALAAGKALDLALHPPEGFVALVLTAIDPGHGADLGAVAGENLFE